MTKLFAQGGRIASMPLGDGTTSVKISGGRYASRIDDTHALLTCGECHQQSVAERSDGGPLSDADINDALTAGIQHDCDA